MGRRKRDGNHSPPKNKLEQDSEGNEENRYPDPDPQQNKDKLYQETQQSPQEQPERNPASNH
jgi:hypothetical protein